MSSTSGTVPRDEQLDIAIRQFRAGIRLIEKSELLEFDQASFTFSAVAEATFEDKAKKLDEHFGRVMYWIWFSTGAEYLLKGFMIVQDPNFLTRTKKAAPLDEAPHPRDPEWIDKVIRGEGPKTHQDVFNTMQVAQELHTRLLTEEIPNGAPPSPEEARRTKAAYLLLKDAIRNRDSHAFVANVRAAHFHMTQDFAPAFDTLLAAAGAKQLLSDE